MALRGRVALVTGASRRPGLGAGIASVLAGAGAHLMLNGGKQRDNLELNAADIRLLGNRVLTHCADVTDYEQIRAMVERLIEEFGKIDILINCAGARGDVGILAMTAEQWRSVLSVNLDGAFNCVKAVAHHMVAQRFGRIINLAGLSGQAGESNRAHVVTAKAGLIGFTKAIASDLGPYGVTANAVAPGIIDTPRPQGAGLEKRRQRIAESPLRRAGSAADIANACVFLAGDEAAFITGQTIAVNGGAYMG